MTPEQATALREVFPADQIGQLPKGGTLLDYCGHASVRLRLLDVDPEWNWEPLASDTQGLPLFDKDASGNPIGLWIRLTVAGVTRLGYGSCPSSQFDAEKVLIGDALRNSAMSFGVATYLWVKGHDEDPSDGPRNRRALALAPAPDPRLAGWDSRDASAAAHRGLADRMAALPDETIGELKGWRAEHGLEGWPLPAAAFEDVSAHVEELRDAAGAAESASGPDSSPEPVEGQESAQDAAPDPYTLPPLGADDDGVGDRPQSDRQREPGLRLPDPRAHDREGLRRLLLRHRLHRGSA